MIGESSLSAERPMGQTVNSEKENTPLDQLGTVGRKTYEAVSHSESAIKFGEKLGYFKTMKGLSTTSLANKTGIAQSYMRSIENGEKSPTVKMVARICGVLGLSLEEFFNKDTGKKLEEDKVFLAIYRLNKQQKVALLPLLKIISEGGMEEGESALEKPIELRNTTTDDTGLEKEEGISMDVGARIQSLRKDRGFTANNLASKSGLTQSGLWNIEHGDRSPTIFTIERICNGMDISLAEFFAKETKGGLESDEVLRAVRRLGSVQQATLVSFLNAML